MRKTAFSDAAQCTRHNYGYSYSGIDLMTVADADILAGGSLVDGTLSFSSSEIEGGAAGFATAVTNEDPAGLCLPRVFDQAANKSGAFDILLKWTEADTAAASVCFGVADVVDFAEAIVAFAATGVVATTHDGVFIYKQEDATVWRCACVTGGVKTDKITDLATGGQQWLQILTDNDANGGTASIRIATSGDANLMPVRETGTSPRYPDVYFDYALDTEQYRPFAMILAGDSGANAETLYLGQVNAWQNRT